jgi:hypothetical protein
VTSENHFDFIIMSDYAPLDEVVASLVGKAGEAMARIKFCLNIVERYFNGIVVTSCAFCVGKGRSETSCITVKLLTVRVKDSLFQD